MLFSKAEYTLKRGVSTMITLKDGTKKETYVHIGLGTEPKKCYKCGAYIGFHKLVSGKYVPVTAQFNKKRGEYEIIVNRGAYGNFTQIHRCGRTNGL